MESIGAILKAARERRQTSIADVVVATKMTSAFVKAIEADDFGAIVAPVYARGFIKLYAQFVGLDPMPLLKQFDVSRRAGPAPAPLPPKAPPRKAAVAYAENLNPKPGQEKISGRPKADSPAAPLRADAPAPMPGRSPAWLASLLAGRLPAWNRMFSAGVQWPRFNLPGIAWRRVFIVALAVLLVIAASLAWEWSQRGLPSATDACRWLAEPPAPYLDMK